jgi:hypothetical protein
MVEPTYMPIIGYPQAWSGSTDGKVTGEAMMAPPITTMAEMDKVHGTLKGKIILLGTGPLDLAFPDTPLASRYTDAELTALIPEVLPTGGAGRGGRGVVAGGPALSQEEQRAFNAVMAPPSRATPPRTCPRSQLPRRTITASRASCSTALR